jgi:putative heme iron utilization protein
MSADEAQPARPAHADDPARAARRLMRTALKAALATLDRETGHPYASLILLATAPGGAPLFLISRLAAHTRNLERDPRASILIDGTGGLGEPMTGERLTLTGLARPTTNPVARRRFLARHASAEGYAGFADFAVYELEVAGGHFVGGFGRIVDLPAAALSADVADAQALIEAEPGIVAHMNSDHADAVALYATVLAGAEPGAWRMTGVDPDGVDLLQRTSAARIDFPSRVRNAAEARAMLVSQVQQARALQAAAGRHR